MEEKFRILILEDNAADADLMVHELRHEKLDFSCRCVETEDAFLKELDAFSPDLILADYTLPDFDAMRALELVKERTPETPVIIVTGSISEEVAVDCMKAGATDYILKDHLIRLAPAIRAALDMKYERERKLCAEEALLESEERFRTLSETIFDGRAIHANGCLIEVNQAMADMLGYEPSEMVGMHLTQIITLETRQLVQKNIQEGFEKAYEAIAVRKHGSTFPIEIVGKESRYQGRKARISAVRDITKRVQAEKALLASERRFRDTVEMLPETVFELDLEANIRLANQKGLDSYGYTQEEFERGLNGLLLHIPEDRERMKADIQRLIHGEDVGVLEYTALRKDGSTFPILAYVNTTIRDGKPNGIRGILIDITERQRAEKALRESEKKYRQLLETLREGIWAIDASAHTTFVNPQMAEMLGYTVEEMIGKHLFSFMDEQGVEFAKRGLERRKAGIGEQRDFEFIRKDGTHIYARLDSSPLTDKEGNYAGALASVTDMTEQRHLEAALRKDEERLRVLFDNLTIGVYRTTPEGKILTANPALVKMLGYASVAELETRNLEEEGFHPTYPRSQFKELIEREGEIRGFESAWHMRDGSVIYVRETARAVRGKDGTILYYEGTAEDITEHKHAEETLRESENKYRVLVENLPQKIFLKDRNSVYISCNIGYARDLKIRPEEIAGRTDHDFYPKELAEKYRADDQRIIESGEAEEIEEQYVQDGKEVFVHTAKTPIRDDQGHVSGLLGIFWDITERKRAEEALRESEAKYRALIEDSGDAIYLLAGGRFDIINRKFSELFEVTPEEVRAPDFNFMQMVAPRSRALIEERSRMVDRGEEPPSQYEFTALGKDGKEIQLEASVSRIDYGGGKAIQGILRDITDRKKLEAQFCHAQKMEAIGTLAGGIAHDFNNILAAMIGYAEMAQKQMPESNITARSDLDTVLEAGSRAKDLVKQILTFSRQTEQEPQLIQIYPVVKEALKLLRASLPTTIEIRENINTDCGAIIGDPTQIHQVLMNLCSNALHAMREKGGVLEVQLDFVEVDAKFAQTHPKLHKGPHVVLTVSDTGQGMDQTTMERIFEPFYTTKAMGEGTGMGLSTTHGIVMSHNGAITVQSELGKGSTFRVYLPKGTVETPGAALEEEAISGGKENILFVDDEERLADLGKKMLEHLGYNVAVRTSSIEALEVFRAQPGRFDLVITDQTMPKMTGIELATEIMRIRPDVPVILSTGYSAIVTPEKAKQVGIRECIMKPMLSAELGKAVRKVLDQERGDLRILADILVIDDDLEVRSMLSDLLQRAGYEVVQCSDGRAAMKVLRERQINIVITDIIMPEKEGIETIQELQQEFPEVKIIAISGGGRIGPSNYLSLAKAFGVQRTFEKPFDNDEMLQAVHELLYAESAKS